MSDPYNEQMDYCQINHERLKAAVANGEMGPLVDPVKEGLTLETDEELLADLSRVREVEDGKTVLEIAIVRWNSQIPYLEWLPFRTWKRLPRAEQVTNAQQKALTTRKYFQRCIWCGGRYNSGHMDDRWTCQGCGERYFGVVH